MTTPRLLVFHPALAPYRVDSFNALARRCQLRLVFLEENVAGQPFDQARLRSLLEVPAHRLSRGTTVGGRTLRLGFAEELRRFRPDAVVTTEFGQATAAVVAHRALHDASYEHLVATEDNPWSVGRETRLHALGRGALLLAVDGVITYSEEAAALYRDRWGVTRPVVASPLVQDEAVVRGRLARAAGLAHALAARHGLLGRRVLLSVGRLAPEKRMDRLVDAVGRLRPALPDAVLVLVGDGPERERLQARAAAGPAAGAVIFAGRAEGEALAAWYLLGGVFALASEHEPFGAVVNEALLAGLPVVCSDRAGARGLVREGLSGAVVDAGRPGALDAALAAWLRRQPPLLADRLEAPPPSLMTVTVEQAVDAFLHAVRAARAHRAAVNAPLRRVA